MKTITIGSWIYYLSDNHIPFSKEKVGKWMCFFSDKEFIEEMCKKAIEKGAITEAKHTDAIEGVACFYLNGDDFEGHKKILSFFIENDLIRKTKTGKLYNIAFKFDRQTFGDEYGKNFEAEIKLDQLIDLSTKEWKI